MNLYNDDNNQLFISAKNGSLTFPSEKVKGRGFFLVRLDLKRKKNLFVFCIHLSHTGIN